MPASESGRPPPRRAPTLREVADQAGVHTSTVSRVLRQTEPPGGWSDSAHRIREIAAALGYRPNPWAASLRTRRTRTIGAVMPRLTDGVVATIYQGVEQAARESGYFLLLSSPPDDPGEQRAAIDLLAGRQVDGLLLSGLHSPAVEFVTGLGLAVPMVALNRHADSRLPYAGGDDHRGGYLAGRHLLDRGYRRLAVIGGPLHASTGHDRVAGFLAAMTEAGVPVPPERVAHANFDVPGGIAAAHRLLTGPDQPDRPDAIFAVSDAIAIGVLGLARDLQLTIPAELGVVGYNDIPFASQLPVPLTSVLTPAHRIGAAAVRLLLERIENPGSVPENVILPVELIARGSTRAP